MCFCLGGEALDECGLRYLLAMRLHTCLLTSLPPLYRMQLLHQGLSTCHFAWAFHSEAEEEMLNMIPAMQRGDPQWSELRAVGVGWWIRNINTLRRMVEKVGDGVVWPELLSLIDWFSWFDWLIPMCRWVKQRSRGTTIL
uniref:RAVE complex protein Rav1 C-terminal domain-containing protein n=1 Tax=Hucho hucho TaxID=62062 RepID=A0A4W5J8B2_9TELE